ncbi:ABC transporter ATP-binding protein [Rhodopirellula sallentina]|uniref:ABC-type multidrug transport system, ATPase and permease component n=1 Tax=Rhodopirellula sallentina SM41 TaxID=1263870 RepID=M5U351_9BACT|nr:ABC transporter ATP-binding protein [Rhodopirellula sallentina]EMI52276.1 ABC-type multidrug transport system, ATPase and permease component [Rhodopirellula sallentina SM41]
MNQPVAKTSFLNTVRGAYRLARPYGRRKLAFVLAVILAQGVSQLAGVASVLPFLAIASDPEAAMASRVGEFIVGFTGISEPRSLIIVAGLISVTALVLANIVNLVSVYVQGRYNASLAHWLRLQLLRHYADLPYSFFINKNSSLLIRAVTSYVTQFSLTIVGPLLTAIASVCTAAMLILAVLIVKPLLTIVGTSIMVAAFCIMFLLLNPRMKANTNKLKRVNNTALIAVNNFFQGVKPIAVHSASDELIESYSKHSLQQAHLQSQLPIFGSLPRSLVEPLAFGGVILYVVYMTANDKSVADILPTLGFVAFVGYRTLPAIQNVYAAVTRVVTASYVMEELKADLDTPVNQHHDSLSEPISWEKQITFEHVDFRHASADEATLRGIDLTIRKGEKLGVVGTTGSGKSTLVDMLLGLHLPTSGKMKIDDTTYGPSHAKAWRQKIGYVPQDIFLLHDSVIANIALGVPSEEIDVERVREVCRIAQVLNFIESELDEKFETIVGERGIRLSGGTKTRIGLARALYHRPEMIVLDEATSALDVATEAAFMKAVFEISDDLTYVVIAHRLSTIETCDRTVTLENGTVQQIAHLPDKHTKGRQ